MSLDNGYVTAEYLRKAAEAGRALKALSYRHMAISPGDILLDAGCGPGVDTMPLAAITGPKGKVIGIDSDAAMLAEAEALTGKAPISASIEHRLGSALALPLDEDSVSASRAERLLQVLPPEAEETVLAELIRVTRPGGRIVLVDTDWGSASVDFPDGGLERCLMEFFALRMRPNGLAGRRLYRLCRELGLQGLSMDIVPMVQHRFADTPFGDWLTSTAMSEGIIDSDQARRWHEELSERDRTQRFNACVNMVIVSGEKPAPGSSTQANEAG